MRTRPDHPSSDPSNATPAPNAPVTESEFERRMAQPATIADVVEAECKAYAQIENVQMQIDMIMDALKRKKIRVTL